MKFSTKKALKKLSDQFYLYLPNWTMPPNTSPVFLSERIDQGSLCTYACKRKRDNFRRATLLYHRLRKNQSTLLKLHLLVRRNCIRIVLQYHGPKDWSEIMVKCEKTFYMYRQSLYSSRLLSFFNFYLNWFIHFTLSIQMHSESCSNLSNVQ